MVLVFTKPNQLIGQRNNMSVFTKPNQIIGQRNDMLVITKPTQPKHLIKEMTYQYLQNQTNPNSWSKKGHIGIYKTKPKK